MYYGHQNTIIMAGIDIIGLLAGRQEVIGFHDQSPGNNNAYITWKAYHALASKATHNCELVEI